MYAITTTVIFTDESNNLTQLPKELKAIYGNI
jgi:hypothetical protein